MNAVQELRKYKQNIIKDIADKNWRVDTGFEKELWSVLTIHLIIVDLYK